MNLDALADHRQDRWRRLQDLSGIGRPTVAETDELIALYRAGSEDLAELKTAAGRTPTSEYLSNGLSRARLRFTGAPESIGAIVPRFLLRQLPAALYRLRWTTLGVAVFFILVATAAGFWVAGDEAVVSTLGSDMDLRHYAEEDFTAYYTDNPAAVFAGMVWTNNAWIAVQVTIFGITGLFPIAVMMSNAVGVGIAAGVMFAYGRGDVFFLFILPHGLLELTSIFVATAAGLHVFWALVAPGARTRGQAVAREGGAMAAVAVGLVLALFLSGLVEGFVTGAPIPPWLKLAIGALALGVFLAYQLWWGRRAAALGEDGGLTEYRGGTPRLIAG